MSAAIPPPLSSPGSATEALAGLWDAWIDPEAFAVRVFWSLTVLALAYLITRAVRPAQGQLLRRGGARARRFIGLLPLFSLGVWGAAIAAALTLLLPATGRYDPLLWGLLGLTAALAFKDILRQSLAGAFIILQGRIRPGDYVRIGELRGRVERLGLQRVLLRGIDGVEHTVPPMVLLEQPVEREDAPGARPLKTNLVLPAGLDPLLAARLTFEVAALSPYADPRRRPEVAIEVNEGGGLRLSLWCRAPSPVHERRYLSQIHLRTSELFRAALAQAPPAIEAKPAP